MWRRQFHVRFAVVVIDSCELHELLKRRLAPFASKSAFGFSLQSDGYLDRFVVCRAHQPFPFFQSGSAAIMNCN